MPATAIQVTCTITSTHITTLKGQGNLDPMIAPPQHMWEEHLANLDNDKCWVLIHLNLLENGQPLATAIQQGQV